MIRQAGFTLIEMVVSLTVMSVLFAITAMFMQVPMQSHFVTRQRVALTNDAEMAVRHMEQELHQSLARSVRVTPAPGGVYYIEFLKVRASGVFRSGTGGPVGCPGGANGSKLDYGGAVTDSCFTSLGAVVSNDGAIARTDYLVIDNQANDAYVGDAGNTPNKSRITAFVANSATGQDRIQFAPVTFPTAPVSRRFDIVSGPVTYVCNPGTGQMLRYGGYSISALKLLPPPVAPSVIATNISACNIAYRDDIAVPGSRGGLVLISLTLSRAAPGNVGLENANVFMQVAVNTTP